MRKLWEIVSGFGHEVPHTGCERVITFLCRQCNWSRRSLRRVQLRMPLLTSSIFSCSSPMGTLSLQGTRQAIANVDVLLKKYGADIMVMVFKTGGPNCAFRIS